VRRLSPIAEAWDQHRPRLPCGESQTVVDKCLRSATSGPSVEATNEPSEFGKLLVEDDHEETASTGSVSRNWLVTIFTASAMASAETRPS